MGILELNFVFVKPMNLNDPMRQKLNITIVKIVVETIVTNMDKQTNTYYSGYF